MKCKSLLFLTFAIAAIMAFGTPSYANTGEVGDKIAIEDLKTEADFQQAYQLLKTKVADLKAEKRTAVTKENKRAVKLELKETRDQVKAVKQAAKRVSGGVYLGTGALLAIIIVLLLL